MARDASSKSGAHTARIAEFVEAFTGTPDRARHFRPNPTAASSHHRKLGLISSLANGIYGGLRFPSTFSDRSRTFTAAIADLLAA